MKKFDSIPYAIEAAGNALKYAGAKRQGIDMLLEARHNAVLLLKQRDELLAAAKMSLQCMVLTVDSGGIAEASIDDCIAALRAAIAKAEGGQDE